MNKSNFSFDTVKNVYKASCAAGIDIVEIGYRNSKKMFPVDEYGPWRFYDEENLLKIVDGTKNSTKHLPKRKLKIKFLPNVWKNIRSILLSGISSSNMSHVP